MAGSSKRIFKKYWFKKFFYAFKGFFSSVREEKSMVVHIILIIMTTAIGIGLKISIQAWIPLILVFGGVVSTELVNTALENVIDMVSFEYNINAQKAKDIAAAATLVVSIISVIVALLTFVPRIMEIANGNY